MISFDALMLKSFIDENSGFLTGARINKIQQPARRELIFSLRNNGQTRQFYINIYPQFYHICFISDENYKKRCIEIPQKPPMFCMLLRKYLNNSRIAKVEQHNDERILEFYVETYNEIGDKIYLCLAIELMGKYSNVILYNTDTGIILGCAHNVGAEKSSVREVYGQIPYTYPPEHSSKYFLAERYAFLSSLKKEIYISGKVNDIFDNYYAQMIYKDKFQTLKKEYKTLISQRLKKCQKSLSEMTSQIEKSEKYDKFRLFGDILMANSYNLKDFSSDAQVYDYENNKTIKIPLKNTKTIKENANDYYKKYNKGKTAQIKLKELIEENEQNKNYLESLLYSIEIAQNIGDLKEIENEVFNNEIAQDDHRLKKSSNNRSQIFCIEKFAQTRIYIGKNNKQNDYIVSKLASDDDLWFHTKDCPGSHVLLKTQNLSDELILECANLAKQNSAASNSSKVGVIYTKCKYLRKPPKANLGYVTYKNEKEIVID